MPEDVYRDISPDYGCFDSALDSRRMRQRLEERLKRIWGAHIALKDFYVSRVIPRENGGLAIQYYTVVENLNGFPERKIFLFGRLLGPSESWPEYADEANPNVLVMPDLRLVVPVFPFDPKLKSLPQFYNPDQALQMTRRLQPHLELQKEELEFIEHEILGYRFERRCVFLYTLGHQGKRLQLIVKVFRPLHLEKTMRILGLLDENGFNRDSEDRLTVPQVYYSDNDVSALFMEAVPGMTLHSLSGSQIFPKACREAARLLRKLHSLDLGELPEHTAADELTILHKRFRAASKIYPRLRDYITRAFEQLGQSRTSVLEECVKVCAHRDYYDKQVLYSPERTALLDFDNIAIADPALDYGNFMAHLFLRGLQNPGESRRIEDGEKAFASEFSDSNESFKRRALWWRGAALVRLAVLYSLRPRWRSLAPDLLDEANKTLK